ncbi:TlpA family protein disulfide reductase [Pseudoflavonifractor phocaeensis]|uniref:TlpA family protein disulfide reductase n=1 Tax=Pseudoflavonifractor phocaeensis TaxID=1870988 RepID=UPI00195665F2|nr:TlpA disulfide reductase family protein [Pseudoflavonifractor phocaeensis]MBM6939183.1 TlpA family protein disulfide reductase [Pseudoflavonifractor phocaeensis]
MKRILPVLAGAALLTLALAACSDQPAEPTPTPVPSVSVVQEDVPILSAFSTTDLQGNEVDQSVLTGKKLTMVNVWATYCEPCKEEMPDLAQLSQNYEDVQIIGLVSDVLNADGTVNQDQVDTAIALAEEAGVTYLNLIPSQDLASNVLGQIYAVPTTFFVNEDGDQVGSVYVGARDADGWAEIIDALLEALK